MYIFNYFSSLLRPHFFFFFPPFISRYRWWIWVQVGLGLVWSVFSFLLPTGSFCARKPFSYSLLPLLCGTMILWFFFSFSPLSPFPFLFPSSPYLPSPFLPPFFFFFFLSNIRAVAPARCMYLLYLCMSAQQLK